MTAFVQRFLWVYILHRPVSLTHARRSGMIVGHEHTRVIMK